MTVNSNDDFLMMIFTEAVKSKVCHLAAVCTMSAYRQLCTVLDDDDDSGSFANNSGPREYKRRDLLLGKINQLSEKIPHESKSRLCQTDFSDLLRFQTQIEIFKHPQASGNIFMSFTPPENKSGNLSNQFKQHKIWN